MPRFRANGFQYPWSTDQKAAMAAYPLITATYTVLILFVESNISQLLALVIPHALLVLLLVAAWYIVESIDPIDMEGKRGVPVICLKKSKIKTRYCGTCLKPVYGLDHHCTWLNTCIGSRNYVSFLVLVVSGALQMGLQTCVGVLYLTAWLGERETQRIRTILPLWVYWTLGVTHCALAAVLLMSFGIIVVFHAYLLLWMRMGTYDWLLRGSQTMDDDDDRAQQEEDQRMKREKEKAWQAMMKENIQKSREAQKWASGTSPQQVERYHVASTHEEDTGGCQMVSVTGMDRVQTEDEVDVHLECDDRINKSTMTRRSGELKPGKVLPLPTPNNAPYLMREIVVSQHSVDFPLT